MKNDLSDRLRRAAEEMKMGVHIPAHAALMLEAAEAVEQHGMLFFLPAGTSVVDLREEVGCEKV